MSAHTILVVDDNLASRRLMRLILDRGGYRVLMAKDLDKALALCRGHIKFDLLIVDAVLGMAQGKFVAECFEELRPGVPVLFTSGQPLQTLIKKGLVDSAAYHRGRASYLQKPFTVMGLLTTVSNILHDRERKIFTAG
jgi:DNA-binding NtrC family response regulator